ncbi:bile acid:sodium symporter family protein [Romboutsia sp. CE17]|uniref:bile acid:sodium symporter family protein n=1 Tax=Romboutsia sp. CE17 TaxID=2724150 RepID=UPI001442A58A|nr:bile acid:sodium symporter family protein [Romboutsia sp. CE17]QJA08270.1 bile acid:sodium symporter family protein [Romboutsia sp. CE17]
MDFVDKMGVFVKKYMSLMVLIAAIIAYFKQEVFLWVVPNMNTMLGFIMFGMGMTLKKDDFTLILKRPKDVIFGTLAQYIIMPLGAFLVVKAFNLPGELAVGLILLGSCPGGVTSNVMSFIAKGDVALSVTFTSISTLLAPIVTPAFILLFAGQWVQINALGMFISITKVVIVPIILGGICHRFFSRFTEKAIRVLPSISGLAMVLLVGGIVSANADKLTYSVIIVAFAVIVHNILGYIGGYITASKIGFDEEKRRVLSIETGMKNATLATTLAMAHFAPQAAIAPAIAGIWHAFSVSVLANYWGNKDIDDNEIGISNQIIE